MFLFTTLALAADPIPFQRGASPGAAPVESGHGAVEVGTGLIDALLTQSDVSFTDATATIGVTDRFTLFGNAQLYQDIVGAEFMEPGTPRFGSVGGRVVAFQTDKFALAPWASIDAGQHLLRDSDEVGAQVGASLHYAHRRFRLDASAPLARLTFDEDPLNFQESLAHTGANSSMAMTIGFDDHHAMRAGMEGFLPYLGYRYTTNRISIEPVIGIPFVGLRAGAQF